MTDTTEINWDKVADEQFKSMPKDFQNDWKDLRDEIMRQLVLWGEPLALSPYHSSGDNPESGNPNELLAY